MAIIQAKPFIGRQEQIKSLQDLYNRKISSIAVIKGRRRVGKSRLVLEFTRTLQVPRFFSFAGLSPTEEITAQHQRDHFGRSLAAYMEIPPITFTDWTDAFTQLAHHLLPGDIVLLDELSWMGTKDPSFISKLQAWSEKILLEKPHTLVIFCSSISIWLEENILNSTAFFGRIALTMTLEPLSIPEGALLLKTLGFKGSAFEIYKLLSIMGGIPWYLEQINCNEMADQNIKRLCFQKDGLLVLEFDRIFHDLFNGKGATYKKILEYLKNGMKTLAELRTGIQFPHSGTLSKLMGHLKECGFVQEHVQWSFKNGKKLRQSLYRISDPYIRFYLRNIESNLDKINMGAFKNLDLNHFPGFDVHMGLQVENLLLQNRSLLLKAMGIPASDCQFDGPYRQNKTARKKGCQIDYLVQARSKNLFLCEFKFKTRELGIEIITEMDEKIKRLSVSRGFATIPVLFHIGGVSASVYDKNYFFRIIDIADFFEKNFEEL